MAQPRGTGPTDEPNPGSRSIEDPVAMAMSTERLAELYPSREEYQRRYAAGIEAAIEAGFVLGDDRAALEGYAHPELVSG